MNNDNRGVLHGSSLLQKIAPRHSPGSFFWCLWWDGGSQPPPLHLSLFFLFIVVFFLLNGVPEVGTCPISPSLQLLGVVVRTEKYGRVRHKALNAIMAAFPLGTFVFSVVLFCLQYFSCFVGRYEVSLPGASCLLYSWPHPCQGGFSLWPRRGFSLDWALGPMQASTWVYWSSTPTIYIFLNLNLNLYIFSFI